MQQVKFLRKKHVIGTLQEDGTFSDEHFTGRKHPKGPDFPSISAAKRASKKLQESNGGMGRGSLKVVEEWPNG
jgi:hypothetical protein